MGITHQPIGGLGLGTRHAREIMGIAPQLFAEYRSAAYAHPGITPAYSALLVHLLQVLRDWRTRIQNFGLDAQIFTWSVEG